MLTGSKAAKTNGFVNSIPSRRVRETAVLLRAWHAIRRNGETSRSPKTREEIKNFGADLPRKLRRIQERLRKAPYVFASQIGATPQKEKGKGKRPLVIAPLDDRIVQRAILDVLQTANDMPGVREVLATPTSIGGMPGRGVADAINMIEKVRKAGNANFVYGSDISGFFTEIKQSSVVSFVADQTDDGEFIELLRSALKVELANASAMDPDDLRLFPVDERGVAQGCPLSALAGNIALRDFDSMLNGRGITCVRYIDDFILLGRKKDAVARAFDSASQCLSSLDMAVYRPETRPDKAFSGPFGGGFEFLGYKLVAEIYPPAEKSQKRIVESVRAELDQGRAQILRALNCSPRGKPLQCYAQTLVVADRLIRAWSGSFGASRCVTTAKQIDEQINSLISAFIAFYQDNTHGRSIIERRRALGVHVLADDVQRRHVAD